MSERGGDGLRTTKVASGPSSPPVAAEVMADPSLTAEQFSKIVALTVAIAEDPWLVSPKGAPHTHTRAGASAWPSRAEDPPWPDRSQNGHPGRRPDCWTDSHITMEISACAPSINARAALLPLHPAPCTERDPLLECLSDAALTAAAPGLETRLVAQDRGRDSGRHPHVGPSAFVHAHQPVPHARAFAELLAPAALRRELVDQLIQRRRPPARCNGQRRAPHWPAAPGRAAGPSGQRPGLGQGSHHDRGAGQPGWGMPVRVALEGPAGRDHPGPGGGDWRSLSGAGRPAVPDAGRARDVPTPTSVWARYVDREVVQGSGGQRGVEGLVVGQRSQVGGDGPDAGVVPEAAA
jgi:hypothetical protein